jgi:Ca-activated chloride channel family protein
VFRAGATTVPVYVSVSDRTGAFVLDLQKDEFELRDNGVPQTITQFTSDVQPVSMLILVDGSASMLQTLDSVLDAANSVVERMLPEDRTALASFANAFQLQVPFTSNRQELVNHIDHRFDLRVAGETRLWEALTESVLTVGKEAGRRVVLVLTDGKQWTADRGTPGRPTEPMLADAPESLVKLALDRNVLIYAIAVWTREGNIEAKPNRGIETVASLSGGGYVEMKASDRVNALATQIMHELHQQYVLGFTPQVFDGTTHKLQVTVTRRHLTVRARASYFAPRLDPRR